VRFSCFIKSGESERAKKDTQHVFGSKRGSGEKVMKKNITHFSMIVESCSISGGLRSNERRKLFTHMFSISLREEFSGADLGAKAFLSFKIFFEFEMKFKIVEKFLNFIYKTILNL
jgi:hypothetical protein